jgi:carbon storage regulator
MLVLSRQRDETIMIGDEIEITVVDIRGDKVRLGINAPTKIAVHRKEVYEAIKRENEQAATLVGPNDLVSLAASASPIARGPERSKMRASASRLAAGPPRISGPTPSGSMAVGGTPVPLAAPSRMARTAGITPTPSKQASMSATERPMPRLA